MPGAVLRASGSRAGIERFLKSTTWKPRAIYWKGEFRYRTARRPSDVNGFNVVVSDASGLNLPKQLHEALRFLRKHQSELRRLKRLRLHAVLDFGVESRRAGGPAFYRFPTPLIEQLAKDGIELEISYYGTSATGS